MMKQMMMRGMDAVMLSCEEATYLITKSEFEKMSCLKRAQLKMHLAGCELCRRFKVQNEIIDRSLKKLEEIKLQQNISVLQLPLEKKNEMEKIISNYPN